MEPTLSPGDIVIISKTNFDIKDVVVYTTEDNKQVQIIHRIIAKENDNYILQGDNNNFIDPYNPTQLQILGKMIFKIPKLGTLFFYLSLPLVWISLLFLGLGLHLYSNLKSEDNKHA